MGLPCRMMLSALLLLSCGACSTLGLLQQPLTRLACSPRVGILEWMDHPTAPEVQFDWATRSFPPVVFGVLCGY